MCRADREQVADGFVGVASPGEGAELSFLCPRDSEEDTLGAEADQRVLDEDCRDVGQRE